MGICQSSHERHVAFNEKYAYYVDELMDPPRWSKELFEDDADFVIGNFPVAIGHVNIAASAQSVYNLCKSLKHTTTKLHDIKDGVFVAEGYVTYTLKTGRTLDPIPLTSVFELKLETQKIQHYRAYIDVTPLFIANGLDQTVGLDGNPTWKPRD